MMGKQQTNTISSFTAMVAGLFILGMPSSVASDGSRLSHLQELLGRNYKKSIHTVGRDQDVSEFIEETVQDNLTGVKNVKKIYRKIAQTIVTEASRYGLDPMFVTAVITHESQFRADAIGSVGEIGLMQLRPTTAEWIAKKYRIRLKGTQALKNPVTNIQLGVAYMAYLRSRHEANSPLYIAAYNMGSTNVRRSLEKQITPKEYAMKVMKQYISLYEDLGSEVGARAIASNESPIKTSAVH